MNFMGTLPLEPYFYRLFTDFVPIPPKIKQKRKQVSAV